MNKESEAFTITLPPVEAKRLKRAAFSFGITPDDLVRHIAVKTSRDILSIPEEDIDEYDDPKEIIDNLKEAINDERNGRIVRTLPRRIRTT
jgi:hypothetical protein